ncbi:MAG: hypothetical protein ACJ71Q_05625 [Terriglobales bacterium]
MADTPKKRKSSKHPKDMTTDEAIKHVFHPKIAKALKKHVDEHNEKPTRKA